MEKYISWNSFDFLKIKMESEKWTIKGTLDVHLLKQRVRLKLLKFGELKVNFRILPRLKHLRNEPVSTCRGARMWENKFRTVV